MLRKQQIAPVSSRIRGAIRWTRAKAQALVSSTPFGVNLTAIIAVSCPACKRRTGLRRGEWFTCVRCAFVWEPCPKCRSPRTYRRTFLVGDGSGSEYLFECLDCGHMDDGLLDCPQCGTHGLRLDRLPQFVHAWCADPRCSWFGRWGHHEPPTLDPIPAACGPADDLPF